MHTAEDASPGAPAFIWLGLNVGCADATPASGVPKTGTLLTRAGLCFSLLLKPIPPQLSLVGNATVPTGLPFSTLAQPTKYRSRKKTNA